MPPVVAGWRASGATEWRCHSCGLTLGFILGDLFLTYLARRELRIPLGGVAVQVCDRCGYENRYDRASGPS